MAAASAVCGALLGGAPGCFTHPINRAPNVMQPEATGDVVRGQDATFTVDVGDPDQDSLDITWALVPGNCLDAKQPANWPKDRTATLPPASPITYQVSSDNTDSRFCVWAFATDRYGAMDANNLVVDPATPANSRPFAMIALTKPSLATAYPLYTKFHLLADGSDADGDPITKWTWLPLQAPTSDTTLGPCEDDSDGDRVRCFTANTPGPYTVSLKVSSQSAFQSVDESLQADTKTFTVMEDGPPCIKVTDPDWMTAFVQKDPAIPQMFAVTRVEDDGDAYPLNVNNHQTQTVTFTWYKGLKGGPLSVVAGNTNQLPIPSLTFSEGDTGVIRVEVRDRRSNAEAQLRTCGDNDRCEANPGSGCYQRVTWQVLWL